MLLFLRESRLFYSSISNLFYFAINLSPQKLRLKVQYQLCVMTCTVTCMNVPPLSLAIVLDSSVFMSVKKSLKEK